MDAGIRVGHRFARLSPGSRGVVNCRTLSEMPMDKNKKKRLEDAGWRVGSAAEFLELSAEEAAFVELKLTLSTELRARRHEAGLSQVELARRLGSSQSRVAKMEASDPTVSLDLLIRALLAAGASRKEIGGAIGRATLRRKRRAATRGNSR